MEHKDHSAGERIEVPKNCEMGMDDGPHDMCDMNDGGAMQPRAGGMSGGHEKADGGD